MELEPTVKPVSLPSPSIPVVGSGEVPSKSSPSPQPSQSSPPPPASPPVTTDEPLQDPPTCMDTSDTQDAELSTVAEVDDVSNKEGEIAKDGKGDNGTGPNLFYTPDEEEHVTVASPREAVFEEPESVSYVPPFNNPIYPNDSFTSYTSAIGE